MILHADGNSFYASCEQIYRPDLRNKPVIVLSNNDGILIAVNKEAKNLGLRRGDPFFKVASFCEAKGVSVFSSNYTLYADINRRITSIYLEYAPEIEEYSIDESFLFFEKFNFSIQDWYDIGFELKNRIYKEVGLPICVGAAPSKTLAKLYNKKAKDAGGVLVYDPQTVDSILEQTDCRTIWGIGAARADTLERHGITNALMLKHLPLCDAKRLLTICGVDTVQELNGVACIDRVTREKKDVITCSRQFGKKIYDIETLECAACQYAELAVEKLRKQHSECGLVGVFVTTCSYHVYEDPLVPQNQKYANGLVVELPRMTCYTPDIVSATRKAIKYLFREGLGFKSVLITLYKVLPAVYQGDLWEDPSENEKRRSFMDALDNITETYGRGSLSLARSFETDGWQMTRNFLSPCWTTRQEDFPHVK